MDAEVGSTGGQPTNTHKCRLLAEKPSRGSLGMAPVVYVGELALLADGCDVGIFNLAALHHARRTNVDNER